MPSQSYDLNDVEIEFPQGEMTEYELEELQDLGIVVSSAVNNYEIERLELDLDTLRQIGAEYAILDRVASPVEVEVMRVLTKSDQERLTTREISESVGKSSSSVSRALSQLVEKGQITKVQRGIYSCP